MSVAHVDLSYLERFCKGDHPRMAKYIALYLAEAPAIFAQLQQAANGQDTAHVASTAHNLRPMTHQIGAQGLMDLLTTVEERANADEPTAIVLLVQDALELSASVDAHLREALAQLHTQ